MMKVDRSEEIEELLEVLGQKMPGINVEYVHSQQVNSVGEGGRLVFSRVGESDYICPSIKANGLVEAISEGSFTVNNLVKVIYDRFNDEDKIAKAVDTFLDDTTVKKRIRMELVNKERNAGILACVPHRDIFDLAVVYRIVLEDGTENSTMSSLISDSIAKHFSFTEDELFKRAETNATTNIMPLREMAKAMAIAAGMSEDEFELLSNDGPVMYVVTTQDKNWGAALMVIPTVLEKVKETVQGDFFILPSSIHEFIAVKIGPEDEDFLDDAAWELKQMVCGVNEEAVLPDDYLSDSVYAYQNGELLKLI